jgi:hypothetical protein
VREPSPRERLARAGLGLLALLAFTELVAPVLIRFLYESDALSGVAWLSRARARHPIDHYLADWRENARWAPLALLGYQVFALASRSPRFVERCVGTATPGALGALRAFVASLLLANALWEHLPSSARIPRELIHGEGVLALLYALPIGFDHLVASEAALAALQAATVLALACAALGLRTRLTAPLAAATYLVFAGILRQYAWFYHTGLVPLYLLIALSFTPCGDGFSLDRRLALRAGRPVAPAAVAAATYGWSRYLVWTALALPYVEAGLSKLRRGGLAWMDGANLKSILLIDTLNPMQFDFGVTLRLVHAPDALFTAIGVATVATELAYGFVLFSPRARRVLPVVMAGMHLGIWLLQNVLFFDLILLQAVFLDWSPALRWLRERAPEPRATASALSSAAWSGPRRLRVLAGLMLFCWAIRIEEYPFTAMQMYSKPNRTGVIEWYAVVATLESGATERAPLERAIPALRDSRYRRALRHGFEPVSRPGAEALLAAFLRAYNAEAEPGARIAAVEVQRWRWNYARAPDDPDHGELDARYGVAAER